MGSSRAAAREMVNAADSHKTNPVLQVIAPGTEVDRKFFTA
jgi:hypothetical protein